MKLQVQLRQSKLIFERKTTNKIEPEKCQEKKGQEKRKRENRYRRVLQSQQSMIAGSVMIYQSQLIFVAQSCFFEQSDYLTTPKMVKIRGQNFNS